MSYGLTSTHHGFELRAGAQLLQNGKFAPTLVITKHYGSHTDETSIIVPPPSEFDDGNAAATHALACGMRWAEANS